MDGCMTTYLHWYPAGSVTGVPAGSVKVETPREVREQDVTGGTLAAAGPAEDAGAAEGAGAAMAMGARF